MIEQEKAALEKLIGKSRFKIMTETAAIISTLLEPHSLTPVVVGGLAVEIYTRGQYTTLDIDMVVPGRELVADILEKLGFLKEGRHWYHPDLEVAVEIPGDILKGADRERVIELILPSGRSLSVIGIEDIILDRLRACVHWQSSSDCEWGLRLLKIHYANLDLDYMSKMAAEDHLDTANKLKEWLEL